MGRPNQCHDCCDVSGPDPPVGDCEYVICVAFMDDNADAQLFSEKVDDWIGAYPNRTLFVLDVEVSKGGMTYPESFTSSNHLFSLKKQWNAATPPGRPPGQTRQFMARDNGDTGIANTNDPWTQIKAIKTHSGGTAEIDFDAATEVAIFAYNFGTMRTEQIRATVQKLRDDAATDGRTIVSTIDNQADDVICPFLQEQCCTNAFAGSLLLKCGLTDTCGATSISFNTSPDNGLIREYCDNTFDPQSPYYEVCNTCITPAEETVAQSIEYRAAARNDQGQILEYIEIDYVLQYFDEITSLWTDLEDLPDGFSNTLQSLSVLDTNWPSVGVCLHSWLESNDSCGLYIDNIIVPCIKRVFSRRFRIKGTTIGFGDLEASSAEFKLFEWRKQSVPPTVSGHWEQIGQDLDGLEALDRYGTSTDIKGVLGGPFTLFVAGGAPQANQKQGYVNCWQYSSLDGPQGDGQFHEFGQLIVPENFTGTGIEPNGWESFGTSLAFAPSNTLVGDGNYPAYLAVGDPDKSSGTIKVFLFGFEGTDLSGRIFGTWTQLGEDLQRSGAAGDGTSVSITHLGEPDFTPRVAIGEPGAGRVGVFQYNSDAVGGEQWEQIGGAIVGAPQSKFGYSVSINKAGNIVTVGAHLYNNGRGAAFAYQLTGGVWEQLGNRIDGENAADAFGFGQSLDDSGTIWSIGARYSDENGGNSGHVRVYYFNGNDWVRRGSDIAGSVANNNFGYAMGSNADGSTFIGGEPNSGGGKGQGKVMLYLNGVWSEKGNFTNFTDLQGEAAGDNAGTAVAIADNGDIVAIGAEDNTPPPILCNDPNPGDFCTRENAGHIRVHKWVAD